jgi:hypothetical protein
MVENILYVLPLIFPLTCFLYFIKQLYSTIKSDKKDILEIIISIVFIVFIMTISIIYLKIIARNNLINIEIKILYILFGISLTIPYIIFIKSIKNNTSRSTTKKNGFILIFLWTIIFVLPSIKIILEYFTTEL